MVRTGALGDIKMISVLMTNHCLGIHRGLPWDRDADPHVPVPGERTFEVRVFGTDFRIVPSHPCATGMSPTTTPPH